MIDLARARAWAVIGVTCFAVLSPLVPEWRGRNGDSFPLSWYPMFARERPAYERPTYVIGTGPGGVREKIDVRFWTSGGFNQGRDQLSVTVRAGEEATAAFCARLAERVARKRGRRWAQVDTVAIVKGQFDRERYFALGDTKPMTERLIYSCAVPR